MAQDKGPPCEICGLSVPVKWTGNQCDFPVGWVIAIGPKGVGAFCPIHAGQSKPLPHDIAMAIGTSNQVLN